MPPSHASPGSRRRAHRRVAGVTVPLFSLRTARSWGIGEIGDLPAFASFVRRAGLSLVQLLPLGEIPGSETSPYSALSAFGIDPMYVAIADVPEVPEDALLEAVGGATALGMLEAARRSERVDYGVVRRLKQRALRFAFARFGATVPDRERAASLAAFREESASWLGEYAFFRAIKEAQHGLPWWQWPAPLAARDAAALARAKDALADEIRFHEHVQWLAHGQWAEARRRLRELGVEIMGDLPFMVGRDSADVWANQGEFRDDRSVGVPGDQFSEDGQDWDLPPYAWDVMRHDDFAWLRRRARYTATLYDRFRVDHLIGFYRTYSRPKLAKHGPNGKLVPGAFDPATEKAQLAHGERVITAMKRSAAEGGAVLIAEDLGVIPDFARKSLAKLGVPGYKVLVWEKDGEVFRDPKKYPEVSVACFGTHDTEPVAVWWESLGVAERAAVTKLPALAEHESELGATFTPAVHRALLDLIAGARSELVLLLVQDVLASRARINVPGTTGEANWSWRLPATIEELAAATTAELLDRVRESMKKAGRAGP